jgi:hypothetical protein
VASGGSGAGLFEQGTAVSRPPSPAGGSEEVAMAMEMGCHRRPQATAGVLRVLVRRSYCVNLDTFLVAHRHTTQKPAWL